MVTNVMEKKLAGKRKSECCVGTGEGVVGRWHFKIVWWDLIMKWCWKTSKTSEGISHVDILDKSGPGRGSGKGKHSIFLRQDYACGTWRRKKSSL